MAFGSNALLLVLEDPPQTWYIHWGIDRTWAAPFESDLEERKFEVLRIDECKKAKRWAFTMEGKESFAYASS